MSRFAAILIALIFSLEVFALNHDYYPQEVQDEVAQGKIKNLSLKRRLHSVLNSVHIKVENGPDLISNSCQKGQECYRQKALSYKEARIELFGNLHLQSKEGIGAFVKDVYCEKEVTSSVGKNKIPNSEVLNCEHTWPQSKFTASFPKDLQKGDLHHLYPTDSRANSKRGNSPFANVSAEPISKGCSSKFGSELLDQDRRGYFEPPENHKGNVARAIFYFSTRYDLPLDEIQEKYLKEWHKEDPVDEEEKARNENIYSIQLNRNPFIDAPELVELIEDF